MAVKAKAKRSASNSDYDNSNKGVLFPNDKEGNENRPDVTGYVTIKVEDYEVDGEGLIKVRLAGWNKSSDHAGAYISLVASAPRQ